MIDQDLSLDEVSVAPAEPPVFVEGHYVVGEGNVYSAFTGPSVVAEAYSFVIAWAGSVVFALRDSRVTGEQGSMVRASRGASVIAKSGAQVYAEAGAMLRAFPGSVCWVEEGVLLMDHGATIYVVRKTL